MSKKNWLIVAAAAAAVAPSAVMAQSLSLFTTQEDFNTWAQANGAVINTQSSPDLDGGTINGLGNTSGSVGLVGTPGSLGINWEPSTGAYDTVANAYEGGNSSFMSAFDPGSLFAYGNPKQGYGSSGSTAAYTGTLTMLYTVPDDESGLGTASFFDLGINLQYSGSNGFAAFFPDATDPAGAGTTIFIGTLSNGQAEYQAVIPYNIVAGSGTNISAKAGGSGLQYFNFGILYNSPYAPNNAFTIDGITVSTPTAVTGVWSGTDAGTGTGQWYDAANWSTTGAIPQSPGDIAQFTGGTGTQNVDMDGTYWSVGTIIFNNPSATYALQPGTPVGFATTSSLTISGGTQNAGITNVVGNNSINVPVLLENSTTVTVSSASNTLTIGSGITPSNGSITLTKAGAGDLAVGSFTVAALNVTAGTMTMIQGTGAGSLGAIHAPTSGTLGTSVVNGTLTLAAGATLDLTTHAMVINYNGQAYATKNYEGIPSPIGELTFGKHTPTQSYPAGSITRYVQTASDGGSWDLSGITSSVAENDFTGTTAVGVIDQNDLFALQGNDYTTANGGPGTWEGVPVANDNNVLVRYTYYGDTNLDGVVNATDVDNLIQGFEGFGDGWLYGDFNYDGIVNGQDVTELIIGFSGQKNPMGDGGISPGQAQFLLSLATGITPAEVAKFDAIVGVPEPTTIGLLGAAGLGLLMRRRTR